MPFWKYHFPAVVGVGYCTRCGPAVSSTLVICGVGAEGARQLSLVWALFNSPLPVQEATLKKIRHNCDFVSIYASLRRMNGATVINSHCMKFFFPSAPLCLVSHQHHFFLLGLMSRLNSLHVSLIHLYRLASSYLWSVHSLLVSFTWFCFYILLVISTAFYFNHLEYTVPLEKDEVHVLFHFSFHWWLTLVG